MEQKYYHISSSALEHGMIFRDDTEFTIGMNDLALCVNRYGIILLCFCLMSNHFHFIAHGKLSDCQDFCNEYKRMCAIRMRQFGNLIKGMKNIRLQYDLIDSQEYLENAIAYVLRNPLAARMGIMPYHYPWSSINLYFNKEKNRTGRPLIEMSERKRFQILRSRVSVPENYVVDDNGLILPSCYVRYDMVEQIFKFPGRLLSAISRKVEGDIEVKMGLCENIGMTDTEIIEQVPELLRLEFAKSSITQLTMNERIRLCTLLKRNFSAGPKQIARITRLSIETVNKVV